jgi:tRNA modification GTPase
MVLAGTGCLLFDTAGLRTQAGEVEAEGVRRALKAAADADLVIEVVDGSSWTSIGFGREDTQCSGRDAIVITKSDLMVQQLEIVDDITRHFPECADIPVFVVSGATGDGIDRLRSFLASSAAVAMKSSLHVNAVVAGERQTSALAAARSHVSLAIDALAEDAPLEVTAAEIRSAVVSLGEITGATITEEVLNRIFSRFCIGK